MMGNREKDGQIEKEIDILGLGGLKCVCVCSAKV